MMRIDRSRIRALAGAAGVVVLLTAMLPGVVRAQLNTLDRAAFIVGNSDYAHEPLYDLDNPLNDARAMNSALSELDFDVTLVEDGDAQRLDTMVDRIAQYFPRDGVGLFYFAGHGVQYKGVNYLLPTDFQLTTPSELPRNSLALNDVLQAMDRAGVRIGIVILDACRESPFGDMSDAFGQGLALVDAPGETLIAYATRPGGLAEDGFGANSPYTGALVSALELPNQSIHEVFAAVRAKVSQATEGRQIPWVLGSLGPLGTRFQFRPVETTQVAENDRLSLPADGRITLASVQWKTIQASVDPTDFERFLMLHRQTPYASLAQRKLEELKSQGRENLPELNIKTANGTAVSGGIDDLTTECDVMAGDPYDGGRITAGVPWDLVNTRIAIRACVRSVAEDSDNPRLLFTLGRALDVAERFGEAEEFYRRSAELDYASAFKNLGYMYRTGRGRADDNEEAARFYREAALRGSLAGRSAVATLYREGLGVPQSDQEALRWYRLAAADGYPGALDAIGNFYRKGKAVEQDPAESVRYYRLSAMLGHTNAMYNLARAYLKGDGVEQDYEEAVSWFVRANEEGNPYAAYYLGRMFRTGWGVDENHRLALAYLRLSADRGFAEAYAKLAEMYESGDGTETALEEAYFLYEVAIAGGEAHGNRNSLRMVEEVKARLDDLRSRIDRATQARAEARAAEWIEQNGLLQFRLVNRW